MTAGMPRYEGGWWTERTATTAHKVLIVDQHRRVLTLCGVDADTTHLRPRVNDDRVCVRCWLETEEGAVA